jgi:hypothetical protein
MVAQREARSADPTKHGALAAKGGAC